MGHNKPQRVDTAKEIISIRFGGDSTMAAPRNKFSKEQIEILQANRYVLDASAARVLFTGEFKERFWELYTVEKMWPVQILR
jgi:hypothetical protein